MPQDHYYSVANIVHQADRALPVVRLSAIPEGGQGQRMMLARHNTLLQSIPALNGGCSTRWLPETRDAAHLAEGKLVLEETSK